MADKELQAVFETVTKARGSKDGKLAPECMKKWLKEAAVIGKDTGITEADVDAVLAKTAKDKKGLDFAEIKECVNALAKEKKVEPKELMEKIVAVGESMAVMAAKCAKDGK